MYERNILGQTSREKMFCVVTLLRANSTQLVFDCTYVLKERAIGVVPRHYINNTTAVLSSCNAVFGSGCTYIYLAWRMHCKFKEKKDWVAYETAIDSMLTVDGSVCHNSSSYLYAILLDNFMARKHKIL